MKRTSIAATWLVALSLSAETASAYVPPDALEGESGLRVAGGEPARNERTLVDRAPTAVAPRLSRFQSAHGTSWRGRFDPATRVPAQLYGGHIRAPGSVRSPQAAEAAARAVLEAHLELLAPGGRVEDLVLSANDLDGDLRTVAFTQRHRGLEVLGGQVSFRFKNDRLYVVASSALPDVSIEPTSALIPRAEAEAKARAWITRDFGGTPTASQVAGPLVLPIVRSSGTIEFHRAVEVVVDSKDPIARFSVYVDAGTGALVARRQTLRFAEGTLRLNSAERNPETVRAEVAADTLALVIRGATVTTDRAGLFTWSGDGPVSATARAFGPEVGVFNDAGPAVTKAFTLESGGTYVWDASADELVDAQVTTFAAASRAKQYVRKLAPELLWLREEQLEATVNINGACNAFSDGETINFFRAGRGCQNTGRIPDVVYHEFGHSVHAHAIIRGAGAFDGALSEGASDYLAATLTNDHAMGRGFRLDDRALRDLDPEGDEATWPADIGSDPHRTGLIFGGAMWDLRKALIGALGMEAGVARADRLWYAALQRAVDIPSSYVEVLAADDDDGDLGNGTPNLCAIHEAFARHGLADGVDVGPRLEMPKANGLVLRLDQSSTLQCPSTTLASAEVTYHLRGEEAWSGRVSMTRDARGFTTTLPAPPRSNVVVNYRVTVELMDGSRRVFPDNEADPDYETYVGTVEPLYCTRFEADPTVEGWTHALLAGEEREGADDWTWGTPEGTPGSGDPSHAFSGTSVFGNDLGGGVYNGKYQPEKTNALTSPPIDTRGFTKVRLQYRRWLTVEDGFFDQARIFANEVEVWSNLATDAQGTTHHQDREWRFHDVDLTGALRGDRVSVTYQLKTDASFDLGGWTIDDFCVVGVDETPRCGDGLLGADETCDDGNLDDQDGCSAACTVEAAPRCGDGKVDAGEACDDGNASDTDGCTTACSPGRVPACGDGVVDEGEACDDGLLDGTACAPGCVAVSSPGATPPAAATPTADAEEGCGCTSTRPRPLGGLALALLLGGLLGLRRRVSRRAS